MQTLLRAKPKQGVFQYVEIQVSSSTPTRCRALSSIISTLTVKTLPILGIFAGTFSKVGQLSALSTCLPYLAKATSLIPMTYKSILFLAVFFAFASACSDGPTQRRDDFAIEGIDVSRYQQAIDWHKVEAAGIDFAYMKATEGIDHQDSHFCDNWAFAKTTNLALGAYHFFRPGIDPKLQADNFTNIAQLEPGDLPAVLDVETIDGATRTELITGMRTWLYLTQIRTGVKPIIYTNLGFYYRHLAGHFDDYTFWIARYGSKEPSISTGANLSFWQYGAKGQIDGIEGPVDLNVFFGDKTAFEKLLIPRPRTLTFHTATP